MTKWLMTAAAASVLILAGSAQAAEGDADKGKRVFNKCKACHMVGEKAKSRVGPPLNEVCDRKAATYEGFKYSKLLLSAADAGLAWNDEALDAYLADPGKFLKTFLTEQGKKPSGRSKMVLKLRKEKQRADVMAYLRTYCK